MEGEREKAQFAQQLIFICILVIHLHKRSHTRSRASRLPDMDPSFGRLNGSTVRRVL